MIRVGIVDFDTSHVAEFTKRLNHVDIAPEEWIDGAQVVAGWPGDSVIMPERIPGYVEKLNGYGVPIVDRMEDLLGRIDAVFIESQQGARHRERAHPFLAAGLPTFIDKPFAANLADADAIIADAEAHRAPLMTCSSLRYAPEVQDALAMRDTLGKIVSADVWTPCALNEGNPGLLHYGVHGVEMLYTLMGPGCREVRTVWQPGTEVIVGVWEDGRIGVVRGIRDAAYAFGFAAHYEKGHQTVANCRGGAYYTGMLQAIVGMFQTGVPPIPYAEMREIMAFMDASLESQNRGGAAVTLA